MKKTLPLKSLITALIFISIGLTSYGQIFHDFDDNQSGGNLFTSPLSTINLSYLTIADTAPEARPGQVGHNRVLKINYSGTPVGLWGIDYALPGDIGAQDFSCYSAISFWIYGANSGSEYIFEIIDGSIPAGPFLFEKWRQSFIDNFTGWQKITLPFQNFQRSPGNTPSDPDDGLTLKKIWVLTMIVNSTSDSLLVDDITIENPITQPQVIYVDHTSSSNKTGYSWPNAYSTVTQALTRAKSGDTIKIAQGFYQEGASLDISKSIHIIGGYKEGGSDDPNLSDSTFIDGMNTHRLMSISGDTNSVSLKNIIFMNGKAPVEKYESVLKPLHFFPDTAIHKAMGGGIYIDSASVLIDSCIFRSCNATTDVTASHSANRYENAYAIGHSEALGGSIYSTGSVIIKNSKISNSQVKASSKSSAYESDFFGDPQREDALAYSMARGGSIFNGGTLSLINSFISDSGADAEAEADGVASARACTQSIARGGAISNTGEIILENSILSRVNVIVDNHAEGDVPGCTLGQMAHDASGGGLYNTGTASLYNSLIYSGKSYATQIRVSTPLFVFDTSIVKNAGAIANVTQLKLYNSILSNSDPERGLANAGPLDIQYSYMQGHYDPNLGPGNINSAIVKDPIFADPENDDFRLRPGSPLINQGNNALIPKDSFDIDTDKDSLEMIPFDLSGSARIFNDNVDIGPYETLLWDNIDSVTISALDTLECDTEANILISSMNNDQIYYLNRDTVYSERFSSQNSDTTILSEQITANTMLQVLGAHEQDSSICLDGSGTNLRIEHSPTLRPTDGITISAWVWADDLITAPFQEIYRKEDGNDRHLFSFQDGGSTLAFGLQSNNTPYQELDIPIDRSDFEGKWAHVAATYDSTWQKVYINGRLTDSMAMSGKLSAIGTQPAYIGSWQGTGEFFNGKMDDVTLWDRALSLDEIKDLMSNNVQYSEGLIFYFDMNSTQQDTMTSSYLQSMKASILDGTTQHTRPDTLLSEGAWEVLSDTHNIVKIDCGNFKLYVDSSATTGMDNGDSWTNAYIHLDSALMHVAEGDTIYIAKGTYECDQTINISKALSIIGSHPNGGGSSDMSTHPTTLLVDAAKAIHINTPSGKVSLHSLILATAPNGVAEMEILNGEVDLNEVEVK